MKKLFTTFFIALLLTAGLSSFARQIKIGNENSIKVTVNTYQKLRIKASFGTFDVSDVKTTKGFFSVFGADGCTDPITIGDPKVPILRNLIEIPVGADITVKLINITTTEYKLSELGIDNKLMPVQPPIPKTNSALPPFQQNKNLYKTNAFYPSTVASVDVLGIMRGTRLGRLNIAGMQYNPVTNTIKVITDITVEVIFSNSNEAATKKLKEMNNSPYFLGFNHMAINSKPVSAAKDSLTQYPVKYVIVCPPQYHNILGPFIEWKKKKGFNVIEAYTDNPNVGTTTTSIKNYLQGLYQAGTPSDPAPSFVLLIGDVADMPSFQCGSHVSDFYYVEYTNDMLPELYIGRMSANNESQLLPQLNKSLEYEKYLMPDPGFLNNVVMIAGVDANNAPTYGNGQINYGTDNYFNAAHGLNSHTYLYPLSQTSATNIKNDVSNGCAYANYTAHGGSSGWSNPSFDVSDVENLTNAHKYPLMIGNCCLTDKFDDPVCFGEALLRATDKGAVGYIGGSNVSYWSEDFYYGCGLRQIVANPVWTAGNGLMGNYDRTFHDHGEGFSQWAMTMAQMNVAGNLAVTVGAPNSSTYYWEIYHLMGDPSLMTYFSVPPPMTANYASLMPLATTSFTVNTNPYAYVAISRGGVLYGTALADNNGLAIVNLNPITTPGYATIVITGQNLQPHIDSIMVATPTGPYVLMNNYQLVDPTGNNNGNADFGETVSYNMTLKNWGLTDCNNVTATISTTDPYATINIATANYGNITTNNTSTVNFAYTVSYANNIPDQHVVFFNLLIQDNSGNSWTATFNTVVNAPNFVIGNFSINDNSGNGDSRLDPGESVILNVVVKNNGHSDAPFTLANMSTNSSIATLSTSSSNLSTMTVNEVDTAHFDMTVSSSASTGDLVNLSFAVGAGAYTANAVFVPTVGLIAEDFETGDLTHLPWWQSGSAPWFITTQNPYEGLYCLKSGNIIDDQQTTIYLNAEVLVEDTISFYRNVSSEPDYDFLQFYIDDTKLDEWAGNFPWARVAYLAPLGTHTFKWTYAKDYSSASGGDCAWIDFVVFPSIVGITIGTPEVDNQNMNFSVIPNPTSGPTKFVFYIEKNQKIDLKVFDATGREVSVVLQQKELSSGQHTFYFNASDLNKGVYFCQFISGNNRLVKKLVVE